jgi:hypothetical protein
MLEEGRIGALIRAVCMDLCGPTENQVLQSHEEGFLESFREQMRGFHSLLRQKPSSLFTSLEMSSISVASLMMHSTYLGSVERTVVLCRWMQHRGGAQH